MPSLIVRKLYYLNISNAHFPKNCITILKHNML